MYLGFFGLDLGLRFDLIVYAPYRSLEGFIIDMEDYMRVTEEQRQSSMVLLETAKIEADKTMLIEVPLLFSHGQLALAALRRSNQVHVVLDFERCDIIHEVLLLALSSNLFYVYINDPSFLKLFSVYIPQECSLSPTTSSHYI